MKPVPSSREPTTDEVCLRSLDEGARQRFETAWREGRPQPLEQFLPPTDDPHYLPTLEELVHIELELAAKATGQPRRLATYLERFPALADPAVRARLQRQEYRVRQLFVQGRDEGAAERPQHPAPATARPTAGGAASAEAAHAAPTHSQDSGPLPVLPDVPAVPAALAEHPRYRVVQVLGAGGMGMVYKAEHRLMERTVALKVISPSLMDNPDAVARFQREVKAAAKLAHPNIVTAHDAEHVGDVHFLVMEYVEGTSLADVVAKRGRLPLVHACNYVRQAALGLQHAYEQGMVHRDIKPHNLMLTPKGRVKVLDFGLARFASETSSAGGLTPTGAVMGTPDYLAPEQARDPHTADIRADIYSLGCTLYCLLTGRAPFEGAPLMSKLLAHVEKDPKPVTEFRQDVPPALLRVLQRMMAKDPAQRFQTPAEVAQALAPFASTTARMGGPPNPTAKERGAAPAPGATGVEITAVPESPWQHLLDDVPERPQPAQDSSAVPGSLRRSRRTHLIGAAVLFVAVGLLAGLIVRITTAKGTLVIETVDPDIKVIVKQGGKQIEIIDPKTNRVVELNTGEYELQLDGGKDGLRLSTDHFILTRNGKEVVKVRREASVVAKSKEPAVQPTKPAAAVPQEEDREFKNSLGMALVLIPAGKFLMGSPDTDPEREPAEQPQHEVQITRSFYLGKYEVTRGQFHRFVKEAPYLTEAEKDGQGGHGFNKETRKFEGYKPQYNWRNAGFEQTDEHPAGNVTWNDAQAFCDWLSRKERKQYRLPTEAEWEYSCRAHTTTRYSSGDDVETLADVGNVADAAAKEQFPDWTWTIRARDGYVFTAPVGRFKPNAFGLLDMHGNVCEWCQDWYDKDYYKNSPARDPQGPGAGSFRVFRGGSFLYTAPQCRAAYRRWFEPALRFHDLGFRVVRVR